MGDLSFVPDCYPFTLFYSEPQGLLEEIYKRDKLTFAHNLLLCNVFNACIIVQLKWNKPNYMTILLNVWFPGGAAARSGRIPVGAELVSAGGQSMEGFTRTQAWAALKALPAGSVALVLRNPEATSWSDRRVNGRSISSVLWEHNEEAEQAHPGRN